MGVHDATVDDAQLVQAHRPSLQLGTVPAGEGDVIQAGAVLVEPLSRGAGVGVQAEQLASVKNGSLTYCT